MKSVAKLDDGWCRFPRIGSRTSKALLQYPPFFHGITVDYYIKAFIKMNGFIYEEKKNENS